MPTKVCSKCGEEKDVSEFSIRKNRKEGLQSTCKLCDKEYRLKNIEKRKEIAKKYRLKNIEENKKKDIMDSVNDKKFCTGCKQDKYFTEFYKDKSRKNGLRDRCKSCDKKRSKLYAFNNYQIGRNAHLKRTYNITIKQYHQIYKDQNGYCAICGNTKGNNKVFHVDHDHLTGKVRGLLCNKCNKSLGGFQDSPEILQKAIDYLNKHNGTENYKLKII
jgi:hypothetical protein